MVGIRFIVQLSAARFCAVCTKNTAASVSFGTRRQLYVYTALYSSDSVASVSFGSCINYCQLYSSDSVATTNCFH